MLDHRLQANVQEARTKHHMDSMKSFMNDVQKQQTQMVENNGLILSKFALLHREIQPHMNSCVEGLEGAADMVDAGADIEAFKTLTKTGSLPEQAIRPAGDVTVQQIHQKRVSKHKIFKTTSRKKDAIRDDFGHLPYVFKGRVGFVWLLWLVYCRRGSSCSLLPPAGVPFSPIVLARHRLTSPTPCAFLVASPEQRKRALKSKLSELNVTLAKEVRWLGRCKPSLNIALCHRRPCRLRRSPNLTPPPPPFLCREYRLHLNAVLKMGPFRSKRSRV